MQDRLATKIFADGADLDAAARLAGDPVIVGFTTNPTLMFKAGVTDYAEFARRFLALVGSRPVSFEVVADELAEMRREALEIASWGEQVYVKVPVTNTRGESTMGLVRELATSGVKVNVTAIFTLEQVEGAVQALTGGAPGVVSVLAGRIADTGRDPVPLMVEAKRLMAAAPSAELLWASPREILNLVQASEIGCDIITMTGDLLAKIPGLGKDLAQFSLETVQMFHDHARQAGLTVPLATPA